MVDTLSVPISSQLKNGAVLETIARLSGLSRLALDVQGLSLTYEALLALLQEAAAKMASRGLRVGPQPLFGLATF